MSIQRKFTIVDWRKSVNSSLLGLGLQRASGFTDLAFIRELWRRSWRSVDTIRFEINFQEAQRDSDFQPIRDPYGWLKETQYLGTLTEGLGGGLLSDFLLRELSKKGVDYNPYFDWIFKGYLYELKGQHRNESIFPVEHIKLLIMEQYDKDRRKFERIQRLYGATTEEKKSFKRPNIPERVRIEIWRRDDGKCVKCGSRERLEYDHIIPISKGGSNTVRNIELLCEKCNRSKGNKIE